MDCVFCNDVRQQNLKQRILEGRSLEETSHAGKPRDRREDEVWMDAGNLLGTEKRRSAASRGLQEENGGAMASKLVDGPEEE